MMKKSELKKILKPLIKECVREAILEDGVLTHIVAEVAGGLAPRAVLEVKAPIADTESTAPLQKSAFTPQQSAKIRANKSKLMEAIGGAAYNGVDLFAGTTPVAAQANLTEQSTPLSGIEPQDPGVDISLIMGAVGRNWNAHMNEMKEGK